MSTDLKPHPATLKRTEERFPGRGGLMPGEAPEPVQAQFWDGRQLEGELAGFFAVEERIEIRLPDKDGLERIRLPDLQWLKFTRAVDSSRNADSYRRRGLTVETLPGRSPFCITFSNGNVLAGELYGYGADLGGLGIYLTGEKKDEAFRVFVPIGGIESFSVGERFGKLLLKRGELTSDGLELALERQRALRKQRFGGLLLERRLISRTQLEAAVAAQAEHPVRPLGEMLVEMGMLTQEQVTNALAEQRKNRRIPIGEILVKMELIDRDSLHSILTQKLGIPYVDLRKYTFDPNWSDFIPYPVCRQNHMVPLYRGDGSITVALDDPLDVEKLHAIAFAAGMTVVPVLASAADIDWALERHPERRLYEALEDAASAEGVPPTEAELEGDDAQELASRLAAELALHASPLPEQHISTGDSTLVRLLNRIIADAHHQKVSDIHIEPGDGRGRVRVRFRRDGALFDYLTLPSHFRASILSRIKIMANLDISEHRHAQDGKIDFKRFGGLPLELRVACIPTIHGLEAVVLRLLETVKPMPLSQIGLPPNALARLRFLAGRPYGLIIVCGPTGSGKTTTLHSVLAHLNTNDTKIWTAEDPVEITQAGLTQVQVQPHIGWTFATALRAFLRADPDVIMVGEVRDAETARIVVEASLTGHLVLTTLHTNSAPESVTRLIDIGIDPFNFTDALLGVLGQRLTRRLCPRCRQWEPLEPDTLRALAVEFCAGTTLQPEDQIIAWQKSYAAERPLRTAKPVGCKACSNLGFAGRLALYELLEATPAIKRIMLQHGTIEMLAAQGIADGMRTLKQDGIEKVLQGLTTIEQVRAVSN